jgi:hypothetical protein
MTTHFVYLSITSGLKVGITRETQIPQRWIDQGAISGLPIIRVATRFQSGVFEEMLSEFISDKTDWRKMLKGQIPEIDLREERDRIFEEWGNDLDELETRFGENEISFLEKENPLTINYPILEFPKKIVSLRLDKAKKIIGKLLGIKGQYLIFETGVFNVRNHSGYLITLKA